jgi:hypothetical protein
MVAVIESEAMTRPGGCGCQCGRKRRGVFPFERVIFRARAAATIPDSITVHFKIDSAVFKFENFGMDRRNPIFVSACYSMICYFCRNWQGKC